MEYESRIYRESPQEAALRRFWEVVRYMRRSEAQADPQRQRVDRGTAKFFASAILNMPSEHTQPAGNSFRSLVDEDPQMARAVYKTFKSTRVMTTQQLRDFLHLPPRGHIVSRLRSL